jgi:hypothetical protein
MLFWGFNRKIWNNFKFSVGKYVLEGSSDWMEVFLLVEFETEVLLGGFADGGFEGDVISFGGEASGSEEGDGHEWEDQVFLLVVEEVVLDGVLIEVEFGLLGDDSFEGKWFFFLEDLNTGDDCSRSGQIWDNRVVLDVDVAAGVGDGIFELSLREVEPARGDVGLCELAH